MGAADREVRVVISGENKAGAALQQVEGQLDNLNHALEALGAAEALKKFADMVGQTIETAHGMELLSQKTGIAVETLSGLSFAAKMVDVDTAGLQKGLKFLAKNMVDTANGGTKAASAFQALGVAVTSGGNVRSIDNVLLDLADKFQKLPDGANKAALAVQIFGRSGLEMVPLLNQGRDGIEALRAKARELGVELSGETAAKAAELAHQVEFLKARADGLTLQFTEGLIPSVMQGTEALDRFLAPLGGAEELGRAAGVALLTLVGTIEDIAYWTDVAALKMQKYVLVAELAAMGPSALLNVGQPKWLKDQIAGIDQSIRGLDELRRRQQQDLFAPHAPSLLSSHGHMDESDLPAGWGAKSKEMANFGTAFDAITKKSDEAVAKGLGPLAEKAEELRQKIKEIHDFEAANPGKYFPSLNADANALESQLQGVNEQIGRMQGMLAIGVVPGDTKEQMKQLGDILAGAGGGDAWLKYDDAMNKAAADLKANTASTEENYQAQLKLINTLHDLGKISDEVYSRSLQNAYDTLQKDRGVTDELANSTQAAQRTIQDVSKTVGTAFEDAVVGGKGARDVFVGLLQDVERELLRLLVIMPLENALGGFLSGLFGGIGGIPKAAGGRLPLSSLGGFSGIDLSPHDYAGSASANTSYLIGTPEIFTPAVNGNIVPLRDMSRGGGGVNIVQNIDARGAAAGEATALLSASRQIAKQEAASAVGRYHEARQRGRFS